MNKLTFILNFFCGKDLLLSSTYNAFSHNTAQCSPVFSSSGYNFPPPVQLHISYLCVLTYCSVNGSEVLNYPELLIGVQQHVLWRDIGNFNFFSWHPGFISHKTLYVHTTCETYFGTKFWKGVVLHLLHRLKRFNLQGTDKILGFVFLPDKQTSGCNYKTFHANRQKLQKHLVCYWLHALTRQNMGRNVTSSSPYIRTFSNCYSVDISISCKEKQHHLQFHLTWARGTQFGQGPVLAVHLSESVSPFARNFRPWHQIYSTAQGSNTIVRLVS